MSLTGQSLRSDLASEPTFVGYAPDSDRDYCGAANAATCQIASFAATQKASGCFISSPRLTIVWQFDAAN